MIDAHYEILKFLSEQKEPIHSDDFPNSIQSQFDSGFDKGGFGREIIVVLRHDKKWIDMIAGSNNVLLNDNGKDAYKAEKEIRDKHQRANEFLEEKAKLEYDLAKITLDTNISVIATNKSVEKTNDATLSNFKIQSNLTIASVLVSLLAVIFGAIALFKDSDAEMRVQNKILEKQLQTVDSIKLYLKDSQSSLDSAK
jgi:hypothetical protein